MKIILLFPILFLMQNCIIKNPKDHVFDNQQINDNKNQKANDSYQLEKLTTNNVYINSTVLNNKSKQHSLLLLQPGFDCNLNLFDIFFDFLSEFAEILILNPSNSKNYNQNEDYFAYNDACSFEKSNNYLGYGNIYNRTCAAIKELKILTNNTDLTDRPIFIAGYSQGGPTALNIYSTLEDTHNIRGLALISPSVNGAEVYNSLTNPLKTIRIINWWLHDLICEFSTDKLSSFFWLPSAISSLLLSTIFSPILNCANLYFWIRGYGFHEFNTNGSNIIENYKNLKRTKEKQLSVINIISSLQIHKNLIIGNKYIGSLIQKAISGPYNLKNDEVLTEKNQSIDSNLYDNVCNLQIEARHGFNKENSHFAILAPSHPQTLLFIAAQIVCNDLTGSTTKKDLIHFLNSSLYKEITNPYLNSGEIEITDLLTIKKDIHKLIIDHICNDKFYKKK